MKRSPASRGYDKEHRAMRKALVPFVRSGVAVCQRCGKPIAAREPWDLGHNDARTQWTGPEHPDCNRSAGAEMGNRRRERLGRLGVPSRSW